MFFIFPTLIANFVLADIETRDIVSLNSFGEPRFNQSCLDFEESEECQNFLQERLTECFGNCSTQECITRCQRDFLIKLDGNNLKTSNHHFKSYIFASKKFHRRS